MSVCVNVTVSIRQWRCVHLGTYFRFHWWIEAIIYIYKGIWIASQMAVDWLKNGGKISIGIGKFLTGLQKHSDFHLNICVLVDLNVLSRIQFSLDNNFCKFKKKVKITSPQKNRL